MSVTIDTLHRVIIRLANQGPVRYWLDAHHDGTFNYVGIAVYETSGRFPRHLDTDLRALGFRYIGEPGRDGRYWVWTWDAERANP